MVYKKITLAALALAIFAAITCNFVLGVGVNEELGIATPEMLNNSTLNVLILIQRYSWPVVTLVFIYALYQFYVIGSEVLEHKILGQRLIVGISIFMVIIQCLPLMYAFLIV